MKIFRPTLFLAGILVLIAGCDKADNPNATMEESNKVAYMKGLDAFKTGNTALLDEVLADNFVDHDPDPDVPGTGKEHWKNQITTYRGAFPDMDAEVSHIMTKDDMVWAHFRVTGTNTGEMGGMPPTGKKMDVYGFELMRFMDGKAVERWGVFDAITMMKQLGMMPDAGQQPAEGGTMNQ